MTLNSSPRINYYSDSEFKKIKASGELVARTLDYIEEYVKPGISTYELDNLCRKFIKQNNARPACLNYHNFPASICTSINEVVCHGIPSKKQILKEGDIINIDTVVDIEGWHGDSSRMYKVGKVSDQNAKLVEVAYNAMMIGIQNAKVGNKLGDIGFSIQNFVESNGFSVVRDYCGHGIGRKMHEEPSILHYGHKNTGLEIKPGMVFTIEPMVNAGKFDVVLSKKDGWTVTTKDGSYSAQWEHTVGINQNGEAEIFTLTRKNI